MIQCWSKQSGYAPIRGSTDAGVLDPHHGRTKNLRFAECPRVHQSRIQSPGRSRLRCAEQMESAVYVTDDFATQPTAQLAQRLAKLTPGSPDKKVFFSQSGAAAVEAAIKAARMCKYNETFLHRTILTVPRIDAHRISIPTLTRSSPDTAHGTDQLQVLPVPVVTRVDGSQNHSDRARESSLLLMLTPTVHGSTAIKADDAVRANLDYLEYLIEQEGGNNKVAAMLIEPVVGSNGIIPPPPGYLETSGGVVPAMEPASDRR